MVYPMIQIPELNLLLDRSIGYSISVIEEVTKSEPNIYLSKAYACMICQRQRETSVKELRYGDVFIDQLLQQ